MPDPIVRRRGRLLLPAVAILAVAVIAAGALGRRSQARQLEQGAQARAIPTVSLVAATAAAGAPLELPARVEPWSRAPIHARVSGYLQRWHADIGTPVKAGQVLAQLDTPELDQEIRQARAELATARSNAALAASTAQRWQDLLEANAVSKQEVDEKAGDLAARQSIVSAARANLERRLALQRYARLTAPFDGVVTARHTDVGALVGVGGAPGSELFVVSDLRRLRVYVNVPQRQVAAVRPGGKAQLTVPERAGRTFSATVQSQSQAIDAASGSMLVQLAVDNRAGELLPGAFATVRFESPAMDDVVTVPPGALILGRGGPRVATVDGAGRVAIRPVTIVRDLGNAVQLAGGVTRGERIIDNPPDGIADGEQVRIAAGAGKEKS